MAKFTLTFDCNNAAFDGNIDLEIASVLQQIVNRIEDRPLTGFFETVRDVNGNNIGRYALKNDDGSNYSH